MARLAEMMEQRKTEFALLETLVGLAAGSSSGHTDACHIAE